MVFSVHYVTVWDMVFTMWLQMMTTEGREHSPRSLSRTPVSLSLHPTASSVWPASGLKWGLRDGKMPSGVWGEIIYNIIAQTDRNTDKSVHCYVIHCYTIPTHTFDEFAKKNIMQSNIFLAIYFYSNIFVTYSISTTVVIKPSHTIHTFFMFLWWKNILTFPSHWQQVGRRQAIPHTSSSAILYRRSNSLMFTACHN